MRWFRAARLCAAITGALFVQHLLTTSHITDRQQHRQQNWQGCHILPVDKGLSNIAEAGSKIGKLRCCLVAYITVNTLLYIVS